jgi:hypothetical protein
VILERIIIKQSKLMNSIEHKKIGKYIMLSKNRVVQLKYSAIFVGIDSENNKKVLIKVINRK